MPANGAGDLDGTAPPAAPGVTEVRVVERVVVARPTVWMRAGIVLLACGAILAGLLVLVPILAATLVLIVLGAAYAGWRALVARVRRSGATDGRRNVRVIVRNGPGE